MAKSGASPPSCPRTARRGSRSRPTERPHDSRLLRARRGPAVLRGRGALLGFRFRPTRSRARPLKPVPAAGRAAERALPRPQAHLRYAAADEGRAPEDRLRDARALERLHHAGCLQPRDTEARRCCDERDGGCAGWVTQLAMPLPHWRQRMDNPRRAARRSRLFWAALVGLRGRRL